uniref:mucin-1-like n=1 Tax=Doryrhamphus excisus TaxID=161450 RepID=UPI0025AE4C0C|nr:mucin-1-like [Doryrhamphus excisus]
MWSALTIWIAVSSIAVVSTTIFSVETKTAVAMATSQDPNITQQSTVLPVTTATNSTPTNFTSSMSLTTTGGTAQTPLQAGGVPAWGIALLVLAALAVLLLLLLLIGLLVWCCCTKGRYKHPDDVPLYNTHSRFWRSNIGTYEDVDKPAKIAAK